MVVRHGIMMVGQTMCGKTTSMDLLAAALTRLDEQSVDKENPYYAPTQQRRINPKSITQSEIYGEVNPVTREWTDGILSNIVRTIIRDSTKSRDRWWIVFDGPVDAVWIENMNTVLDDSKMLCLVNGERIKLPFATAFAFEVQDLKQASPATVSRCGMVFLEPYYLAGGWRPIAHSMNSPKSDKSELWNCERVHELLEIFIPPALEYLRANCKEWIRTCDGQLVESLLFLLRAYLANIDVEDDDPKQPELQVEVVKKNRG